MQALLFPIPPLPEFADFENEAGGDTFRMWYLVLNNFHFNLPYTTAKVEGVCPSYYETLIKGLNTFDVPNHQRVSSKLGCSDYFMSLTPRSFYGILEETMTAMNFKQRIIEANTLRMTNAWEQNVSWLHPLGVFYVALRMKGFNRADLVT